MKIHTAIVPFYINNLTKMIVPLDHLSSIWLLSSMQWIHAETLIFWINTLISLNI